MFIYNHIITFSLISVIIFMPISLFIRGFLLTKDIFSDKTDEVEGNISDLKVILLIVDALRYDFVKWNHSDNMKPYLNQMVFVNKLFKSNGSNIILYEFLADPPTTTLQRLKALTTGSLPTFLDIKSNFWAYEIQEDNIIDQIVSRGMNIVFVGDDTWSKLYPNRFIRQSAYSSFDVWDLDTVDDGVINEFDVELSNNDWNVLIGHMLGVDHTGHTFGPLHHLMPSKLHQIDSFISDIINRIDSNTVLFIFGDHGMTESGDHGGSSYQEISSALIVYCKNETIIDYFNTDIREMQQIDLVATLAHLLNVPIPYSNLGISLLTNEPNARKFFMKNIKQVYKYFRRFPKMSAEFSRNQAMDILKQYGSLNESYNLNDRDFIVNAQNFILTMQNICRSKWVQFGYSFMYCGIIFLSLTLFYLLILVFCYPITYLDLLNFQLFINIIKIILLISIISYLLYYFHCIHNILVFINFIIILVFPVIFLKKINYFIKLYLLKLIHFKNYFSLFILLLSIFAILSNSFVVHESYLLSYFIFGSFGQLFFMRYRFNTERIHWKSYLTSEKGKLILSIIILLFQLKFSTIYWVCREEHGIDCVVFKENSPISTISSIISIILLMTAMNFLSKR
ncbi:hypothetical protein O3M35_004665 [Rhynocoris fuscipes]|uniref:GPI ethanolamine phosphate transferase 3 n=1 Tax=Rhynocoris fuscipes TaxID=488301 RepID=A0AAW1CGE3_9HEMI